MSQKPLIAVSSCLAGYSVRYDGSDRFEPDLVRILEQHFSLVSICPEVAIGLGTPRPPIKRVHSRGQERLVQVDDISRDITDAMQDYFVRSIPLMQTVCAYVFKARSPSCGPKDVPIDQEGSDLAAVGRGLFVHYLSSRFPDLPVADEDDLRDGLMRGEFIDRAKEYFVCQKKEKAGI